MLREEEVEEEEAAAAGARAAARNTHATVDMMDGRTERMDGKDGMRNARTKNEARREGKKRKEKKMCMRVVRLLFSLSGFIIKIFSSNSLEVKHDIPK